MRRIAPFVLIIFGIALIGAVVYFILNPSIPRSTGTILGLVGGIIVGILSAGTGIKDWLELLKGSGESKPETKIEISGESPQISAGDNSRNIQTGGGNYIENLEITLSIQDESFVKQLSRRKLVATNAENITPFLIGIVLDLSRSMFDSVYQISEKDEDFFQRLIKALNTLVNKSLSYCEHPHSKDILPKFSLFFYGFGFGNALKGFDSMIRRLGLTSDIEVPTAPIRDLLKLTADTEELPYTPNAEELNKYWKTYRTGILAQYIDMEFDDAPLLQALRTAHERFKEELKKKGYQPLLLVITNGKFTDGNYSALIAAASTIKDNGITLVIGFVGKKDIMPARILVASEDPNWDDTAKALFQCASDLNRKGRIGKAVSEIAIEKSWEVPEKAKLFIQINQQEMLEELIDIVTSPLRG